MNNNSPKRFNWLILLVVLLVVAGLIYLVNNYFGSKSLEGEIVYVSNPGMAEEIARLKAEQETILFESRDKAPFEFLLGIPVETNPVEIDLSSAIRNFEGTENEVTFVRYVYYSILSRAQIVDSFKKFFLDENYSIEEVNEDSNSAIFALKEKNQFSVSVSSVDGGLSYVTISLTIK